MSKTQDRITPENVGAIPSSPKDKEEIKKAVEKPFVCDICNKVFKSKAGLVSHKKSHDVVIEEPVVEVEEEGIPVKVEDPLKWVTQYLHGPLFNHRLVEAMSKEPRVTLILPRMDSESKSAVMEAKINGQAFEYPKGIYFECPKSMATLLMGSVQAESTAGADKLVGRSEEVKGILS